MKNIFIFILAFVMSMPKTYFVEIDKGLIFKTPEYKINPEEYIQIEECVENLESLREKCKKYYDS